MAIVQLGVRDRFYSRTYGVGKTGGAGSGAQGSGAQLRTGFGSGGACLNPPKSELGGTAAPPARRRLSVIKPFFN